ncbi:MAG: hypothetical protein RMM08_07220 [Armatimonadota bacterium]|nr:hypothetical protein [bacterium]MDW8321136.1 hypothetical protein [Armatimonadota bacterium]
MELVRVVVKRHSTDDSSELNINIQTTPIGSLLAGAAVIWLGAKLLRMVKRRWWLPMGAGAAMLALRQWQIHDLAKRWKRVSPADGAGTTEED